MKKNLLLILLSLCLIVGCIGCDTIGDPSGSSDAPGTTEVPYPGSSESPVTNDPDVTTDAVTEPETEPPMDENSIKVSYNVNAVDPGKTFTGLPALEAVQFIVRDYENKNNLPTKRYDFSFGAAKNGEPHSITVDNQKFYDSLATKTLAWDNKSEGKVLYLTFDCGYQYKDLVPRMLDTLKEKGVQATFFCTLDYIEAAPDEVARMINEGHLIGNHTTNHPSDCATISRSELAEEILGVHNYLRVNFGYNCRYFRFPAGVYSENTLELVSSLGYRTAFWSIAHADWDPENQPGVDVSFKTITDRLHPGAVILLHSTSPDNAAILGQYIDYCRAQGYEFRSLDDYKFWDQ